MSHRVSKWFAALPSAGLLFVAACGLKGVEPTARVEQAWVRLPAAASQPAAGYFRMEASGPREVITSISSPEAERIEMHMSTTENGISRMVRIDKAHADQATRIAFEPGGRHLMIFGLNPEIRPGSTLRLDFRFVLAPPVSVEARVIGLGDEAPEGAGPAGH